MVFVIELIGHREVKDALAELRHPAVLLCGPARVGRRALAFWYAAFLNCAAPELERPCGRCPSCTSLNAGTHPDVRLIEPKLTTASGRTAQRPEIRVAQIAEHHDRGHEFEEHVLSFLETAAHLRHKVVIFDPAETLNEAAANALLKVIEEPPHGARFVFIAEDQAALLPTIVSRSVRLRVAPVAQAMLEHAWLTCDERPSELVLEFAAGRPGLLIEHAKTQAVLDEALAFVSGLRQGLLGALTAADRLAAHFSPVFAEALTFVVRGEIPQVRGSVDRALQTALLALERYASPSLALAVLALEIRAALMPELGLGDQCSRV